MDVGQMHERISLARANAAIEISAFWAHKQRAHLDGLKAIVFYLFRWIMKQSIRYGMCNLLVHIWQLRPNSLFFCILVAQHELDIFESILHPN